MWAFDEVQAERLLLPTPISLSGQLLPVLHSQAPGASWEPSDPRGYLLVKAQDAVPHLPNWGLWFLLCLSAASHPKSSCFITAPESLRPGGSLPERAL